MNASLKLRSVIAMIAVVVASACSGNAPDAIALSDDQTAGGLPETVIDYGSDDIEPELVSTEAEAASETTTTTVAPAASLAPSTTAATTSASLADTSASSSTAAPETTTTVQETTLCERGANFPQVDGPVSFVDADMDGDGEADRVHLIEHPNGLGSDGWVAVTYANGGIATGKFDGFFEVTPDPGLMVADLTNGTGTSPEIIFVASSGPSIEQVAVMTVIDCEVVTTTLFDEEFSYNRGAGSGYASTGGCAYGTGGRLEFTVTEVNPNIGDWTTSVYTLEGSEWTRVDRFSKSDFPTIDSPTALSLQDCTGVIASE